MRLLGRGPLRARIFAMVALPGSRFVRLLVASCAICVAAAHAESPVANALLLDAANAGDAVIAVGERGTILRSTDSARTWSAPSSPAAATLTGVSFADEGLGWAVGHDALVLATRDGGLTWSRQWQGENLSDSFLDVLALDAAHVIAVGAYGLCLTTADGGHTWTRANPTGDDAHLNRLTRGPTGTLYLAGERGTLLRSADAGRHWTAIPTDYDGSFYGILPLGPTELLAYGLRGHVFHSTDDGKSWQPVALDATALLATALVLPNRTLLLAGSVRTVFVSRDPQHGFVRGEDVFPGAVAALLRLPDGAVLAVGEAGATRLDPASLVKPTVAEVAP